MFSLVFEYLFQKVYLWSEAKPQIQTKEDNLVRSPCYGFGSMSPIQKEHSLSKQLLPPNRKRLPGARGHRGVERVV